MSAGVEIPRPPGLVGQAPVRAPPGLEDLATNGETGSADTQQRGHTQGRQSPPGQRQSPPPGQSAPPRGPSPKANQGTRQSPTQRRQSPTQERPAQQPGYVGTPFPMEHGRLPSPPVASDPRRGQLSPNRMPQPTPGQARGPPQLPHQSRGPGGGPTGQMSGAAPQQWNANQQMHGKAQGPQGNFGQRQPQADHGSGAREQAQNWLAAGRSGGQGASGPSYIPEAQMLPSPGLPTGLGIQMPGMPQMPGMTWPMAQQMPARQQQQVGAYFQDALQGALQKFAMAEEVQKAATPVADNRGHPRTASGSKEPESVVGAIDPEQQLAQRLQAQAQAEATAARLNGLVASGSSSATPARATKSEAREQDSSATEASASGPQEKRYEGRVKTFNLVQGFGFIQSLEIHQLYGCDAFLNTAVSGGLVVGSVVTFSVEEVKGRPQARNVVSVGSEDGLREKDFDQPGTAVGTHSGRVKSFNASKGFGFITSRELQYEYGGKDVYVSKTQAPEGLLSVGQEVEFQLVLDRQGQPQARDIKLLQTKRGPGMAMSMGQPGMPLFA